MKFCIERHNLSEQQMSTVQVPLRGLWSYKGPLTIAAGSCAAVAMYSSRPTLTHVAMNESLAVGQVVDGLEKLPKSVEDLELQIKTWDVEVLFAVRSLLPDIKSLVIRYGGGMLPPDFFVTLGSGILFDLRKLHTIKIFEDGNCIPINRGFGQANPGGGHNAFPQGAFGLYNHLFAGIPGQQPHPPHPPHTPNNQPPANTQRRWHPVSLRQPYSTVSPPTAGPSTSASGSAPPSTSQTTTGSPFYSTNIQDYDDITIPSMARSVPHHLIPVEDDVDMDAEDDDEEASGGTWIDDVLPPADVVAGMASTDARPPTGSAMISTSTSSAVAATASSSSAAGLSSAHLLLGLPQLSMIPDESHQEFLRYQSWLIDDARRQQQRREDRVLDQAARQRSLAATAGIGAFSTSNSRGRAPVASAAASGPSSISSSTLSSMSSQGSNSAADEEFYFPASPSSPVRRPRRLEHSDLADYLIGWNRHCPSLRHVQISWGTWWERRFEGDRWIQKWSGGGGGGGGDGILF